ncbi:MAG: polysaccharide ABC transporter ATP-binding protein [Bacteroidales bacterium]|nr:polysaccharide ABC transporter ATP-binding protein [Bacteroidales bacterium]
MPTAIEFNNISKQYRLGLVSTKTLGADLNRWWTMTVRHKEDPYLKIGSVNDRSSAADSEFVWALRDIDFKVEQGDVVGIIGKNGAGKSTLLKLLSKVTAPTTGTIKARGRIGSLLEVGTGFHPEMTGRENIYLNGAIMGMTKHEITSKLDEIVDFSGCERYLDTPVKRYSSGMTVRLGFAVAAHLDPEILVVDEVLAVGDAEFQKKAIGKMQDVSRGEGRTVLFVSHNMDSVRNLCNHGVVLKNGMVDFIGDTDDAVDYYLQSKAIEPCKYAEIAPQHHVQKMSDPGHRKFEFVDVRILNNPLDVATDEPIELELTVKRNNPKADACQFTVIIHELSGKRIATFISPIQQMDLGKDVFKVHLTLKDHCLAQRTYDLQLDLGLKDYAHGSINYDGIRDFMTFKVGTLSRKGQLHYGAWDSSYGFILNNNSLSATVE